MAQPQISASLLGYTYDPGVHAIRAIRGIPGAALLAETVDADFHVARAVVSPTRNFALTISTAGDVRLVDWSSGAPSSTVLAGLARRPDFLIFSNSGLAAVAADSQSGQVQVITSLPASPAIQDVPLEGNPAPAAIAVNDDATIAMAFPDSVRLSGTALAPFSLPLPGAAALAFAPSGRDLLAVTGSGDLYVARNVENGANIQKLASDSRFSDVIAIQFSGDASSAFIASRAGVVSSVDLDSGAITALSCQCVPTALDRLAGADLFRLTGISRYPVLLFDGTPQQRRLWFVPAGDWRKAR